MKTLVAAALVVGALLAGPSSPSVGSVAHISTLGIGPNLRTGRPHGGFSSPGSDLTYHGGWVMRTNKTYAIYWVPSGFTCRATDPTCSNYESAINRYFKDVASAKGSDTNVYSVDTQYYDTTGPIAYQSTFGGWVVDHGPFPPYNPSSSCKDGKNPVCLTDQQLR